MAINKRAKNIYTKVEKIHTSISGNRESFYQKDIDLSIKEKVFFKNQRATIELDLTLLLQKNEHKKNNLLEKWKTIIEDDKTLELYWKITYSKETELKLNDEILNIFVDIHMINILDNHYRYTCNGGWIDKHHFSTTTIRNRIDIGATNLWKQILNETGEKSKDGKGFLVIYTQDMGSMGITIGETYKYWLKSGLDISIKEKACMAIFQEVSIAFEKFQSNILFSLKTGPNESSFEPSDLVSNMLGLYSILRKEDPADILNKLRELDARSSLKVYNRYIGTFSKAEYKNYVFYPKEFPNDACTHTPKCKLNFPKEYQSIQPLTIPTKGILRRWINGTDDDPSKYENLILPGNKI